jgi:4-aminobutyrate aminotransferase-like enzyme
MLLDTETETPAASSAKAGLDIRALLEEHAGRNYELHAEHVNPANVRTLKTIGFDRCYVRAEGPYLWDVQGNQYLDMLSGYGVFGLGRNHREVRRVLTEFLDLNYPSLVKMEAPLLSGLLAEQLKQRMPNQLDMVFFTNSGAEGMEAALKYARCESVSWIELRGAVGQWRRKFPRRFRAVSPGLPQNSFQRSGRA